MINCSALSWGSWCINVPRKEIRLRGKEIIVFPNHCIHHSGYRKTEPLTISHRTSFKNHWGKSLILFSSHYATAVFILCVLCFLTIPFVFSTGLQAVLQFNIRWYTFLPISNTDFKISVNCQFCWWCTRQNRAQLVVLQLFVSSIDSSKTLKQNLHRKQICALTRCYF